MRDATTTKPPQPKAETPAALPHEANPEITALSFVTRGRPAVAIAATLAYWLILAFRIPVFTSLPAWFWRFSYKPIGALWVAPVLALLVTVVVRYVLRTPGKVALKLVCLVALGFVLQQGFGWIEGRGISGIRDRMVYSGHTEFAVTAVREKSIHDVLVHYEARAAAEEFGNFARSKPPGQLLLYMVTQRVANWVLPAATDEEKLDSLRTFASIVWPLIAYLVLIPIYVFGSRYLTPRLALLSCCLYILVPSVTLMTLHTDEVFYPLFAMTAVLLFALAVEKRNILVGLAAGAWYYLVLFCTFGFLVILPLFAAAALGAIPASETRTWKRVMKTAAAFVGGFIALDLLFRFFLDYDIVLRYRNAMAFHMASKYWVWEVRHILYFPFLSALEYALWVGLPIVVFAFGELKPSIRELTQKRLTMASALPSALFVVFVALVFFSRTGPESARIWMFLVPFVCLVVGGALVNRRPTKEQILVPLVFGLQGVTILVIKLFQDFR